MAGRIFTIISVLVLLSLMPVIDTVTLMIRFMSYELLIFSPAFIAVYLYVNNRRFRQVVRMIVKVIGNATNTFVRYF